MRSRRRLVLPVLVIAAAGAIAWWAARGREAETAEIERGLHAWAERAAGGGDADLPFPVHPEMLAGTIRGSLRDLAAAIDAAPGDWNVTVAAGPGPDGRTTAATHHGWFTVAGANGLGLQFAMRDDGPVIVGSWRTGSLEGS